MLRHIVLFQFESDLSRESIDEISKQFLGLKDNIEEVMGIESGLNNSPEGLDQGFTHCFQLTFATEADRDAYLPHPAHQAFVKLLDGKVLKVLVFDYSVGD